MLDALYLDLHRNPELSLHEERTAAEMAARLRAVGFEVTEHVGGTGIVGVLANGGAAPHRTVDPVLIAARAVVTLQNIVSREINPFDPAPARTTPSSRPTASRRSVPGSRPSRCPCSSSSGDPTGPALPEAPNGAPNGVTPNGVRS